MAKLTVTIQQAETVERLKEGADLNNIDNVFLVRAIDYSVEKGTGSVIFYRAVCNPQDDSSIARNWRYQMYRIDKEGVARKI